MEEKDFYKQLKGEVITEASNWEANSTSPFKEMAYAHVVVNDLAASGNLENPTMCYYEFKDGNADGKIHAYNLVKDEGRLDIIIAKYFDDEEINSVNQSDLDQLTKQASRFCNMVFSSQCTDILNNIEISSETHAVISHINDNKEFIKSIRLLVITNGKKVARSQNMAAITIQNIQTQCEFFDLTRHNRFRDSGSTHEDIDINLSDYLSAGDKGIDCTILNTQNSYETALTIFPGKLLANLYDKFGSRLLESNVRAYLQAKGKVNKGILNTVITEPEKFITYNNGITIVAEGLTFNDDNSQIYSIKGLQIVNGGQTTATIHRAIHIEGNDVDVDKINVQAKITIVPKDKFDEIVPLISEYSNTQNAVSKVDLRAAHPYHVQIERLSRVTWCPGETSKWFYERARGSYQTQRFGNRTPGEKAKFDKEYPSHQKITKEDVARFSNTWSGRPDIVSKGGQNNFVVFMEALGPMKQDFELPLDDYKNLIAKAIIYKKVATLARQLKIEAFKVNVVNYTAALLVEKTARRINLMTIWERQALDTITIDLITEWIPKVEKILRLIAGERNPGEVYKLQDCWKEFKKLTDNKEFSALVIPDLRGTGEPGGLQTEDEKNINRCMEVSQDKWNAIISWGSTTGLLDVKQIGISNSMMNLAVNGYEKQPSKRQAFAALKILDSYTDSNN